MISVKIISFEKTSSFDNIAALTVEYSADGNTTKTESFNLDIGEFQNMDDIKKFLLERVPQESKSALVSDIQKQVGKVLTASDTVLAEEVDNG